MNICRVLGCQSISVPNEQFCDPHLEDYEEGITHRLKRALNNSGPGKGCPGLPRTSKAHQRQYSNLSKGTKFPEYESFKGLHPELLSLKEQIRAATQEIISEIRAKRAERKANANQNG
jgi:hypothetical protein